MPDNIRLRLLEVDADQFEKMVADLERALTQGFERVSVQTANTNRLLLSLLVAVIASMVGVVLSGVLA